MDSCTRALICPGFGQLSHAPSNIVACDLSSCALSNHHAASCVLRIVLLGCHVSSLAINIIYLFCAVPKNMHAARSYPMETWKEAGATSSFLALLGRNSGDRLEFCFISHTQSVLRSTSLDSRLRWQLHSPCFVSATVRSMSPEWNTIQRKRATLSGQTSMGIA